jgi:hypothetical protein
MWPFKKRRKFGITVKNAKCGGKITITNGAGSGVSLSDASGDEGIFVTNGTAAANQSVATQNPTEAKR